MAFTHVINGSVLTIRLHEDLDVSSRGSTLRRIEGLLHGYRPGRMVVEMADSPIGPAALSTVLRVERRCEEMGVSMVLVASAPEARRQLRPLAHLPLCATTAEAIRLTEDAGAIAA
ncbi:hypothetical protein AB0P15_29750 [Streptomyces sp. NPDC087917]|uniref:hypothetical protein n=1 Tax=Streptomyces sp. NPDC087917 TaxID=3155060 RepID=UPI003440AD17